MSNSNKVDYNKLSDEELSRMELIRKAEERDRVEGYKKTGKKVMKWYFIGMGVFLLFILFIASQLFSSLSNFG
ncbi:MULTISPECIES: hypothetical protein [Psychrobacter]|uniref:hypothetical protein n=1 Tax=Psychrobacter TaxID=497 RepID=UPI0025ECFD1E|nr:MULTISPECIES: hypothetical protein [unclassified Psychrobacter]